MAIVSPVKTFIRASVKFPGFLEVTFDYTVFSFLHKKLSESPFWEIGS